MKLTESEKKTHQRNGIPMAANDRFSTLDLIDPSTLDQIEPQ